MKIVVAMDSFKGSLTSTEAGEAVRKGIRAAKPKAAVIVKPLADGGEGTAEALIEGLGGEWIEVTVTGPMGTPVNGRYGYLKESDTAILDTASVAGLTLVSEEEKNPLEATTRGVGELILAGIAKGCRRFLVGIGGSATNDAGLGMLKAMGFSFLDQKGEDVGEGAQALQKVASVSFNHVCPQLKECYFQVACDVKNPLCGKEGATYIYGSQKGILDKDKPAVDQGMAHFADIVETAMKKECSDIEGAGAAGGLGFAFLSCLNGELVSGIDLVMRETGLEEEIKDADIVVTGEGCLDAQTAMGKAPTGIAGIAHKYGAKVIAFAGAITDRSTACSRTEMDAVFPILDKAVTLEEAMEPERAKKNLQDCVEQVFRLL